MLAIKREFGKLDYLAKATIAAEQENWSLLNQCLQHLLQSKSLVASNEQQILNWALEILTWGDFQDRWDVAKIFPGLGKEAIAPLIAILEDEEAEEELRWFVARILGEFNDSAVILPLIDLLKSSGSEELSAMATTALANLGKSAINALTDLLTQEQGRLLAVRGLAHIRTKETITPLLSVVNDQQVEVRATAIEALGSFHDPLIFPVLLAALKDVAASVRKEAVIALGVRSDLKNQLNLVQVVKPLLWDFNIEVCQQAAIALGRLGTDEAADALFLLWQSSVTPLPLQLQGIRALGWVETP
ncbi:MAG TPA: HEAT repeat domain-containing protein, partial [Phormidium sp.]